MNPALALLTGNETEADLGRIRLALERWLTDTDGPSLQAYLGISRSTARKALRDRHLRAAATYLDGGPWSKALALGEAARAFEVRRWPKWRRSGPPTTASDLDLELFSARQYGDVCMSTRQLFRIIAS